MAFELGDCKRVLRCGDGKRTRGIRMRAWDLDRLKQEIARAKNRFQILADECGSAVTRPVGMGSGGIAI